MSNDLILTRDEIRAVDRLAVERLGIPGVVLMENAGRGAAEIVLAELGGAGSVCVVCGPGNNGGDGYVVARHLANAGIDVTVLHAAPAERSAGDAGIMREIVSRMETLAPIVTRDVLSPEAFEDLDGSRFAVCVDGILGTGFAGEVREPLAAAVRWLNGARERGARLVSLDLPSGLDCDSGAPARDTVTADRTVTFAALKPGLLEPRAGGRVGKLDVVSIGVPRSLLESVRGGE